MIRYTLAPLPAPLPASVITETLTGAASLIYGDTIEIRGQRVRLLDVDSLETKHLDR